jgi:Na+/melibiose symporter-like transporter
VLFLNAASFLFMLLALLTMRLEPTRAQLERVGLRQDLRPGLGYVRSNQDLLVLMVLSLLPVLFVAPYRTLLPIFARDILGIGSAGYGLLMAAPGIGGLANTDRGFIPVGGLLLGVLAGAAGTPFAVILSAMACAGLTA